jgi:hypothetical protein
MASREVANAHSRHSDSAPARVVRVRGPISHEVLAYVLAVVCVIIAAIYFTLPRESLPIFLPGHMMGADRIYYLHGVAALAGAVAFMLIGLSVTPSGRT